MKHDEKSDKVAVDATFDSANPADFDAVLLPGGALNADALRVMKSAQQFVQGSVAASQWTFRRLIAK
jgi:protease I